MNESMIERVARAICLGDPDRLEGRIKSEKTSEKTAECFRVWSDDNDLIPAWRQTGNLVTAKQAIKTMREPTEEMVLAAVKSFSNVTRPVRDDELAYGFFCAMIDKALEDG